MSGQVNPSETAASSGPTSVEEAPPTQQRGNRSRTPSNQTSTLPTTQNCTLPIHRLSIPIVQPPFGTMMDSSAAGFMQIPPHTAARVLKGEIHNVLTVMRADPRYVSPHRFEDELVEQYEHPLLAKFRDLHATLCAWESAPQSDVPDAMLYLPPFCEAIQGRDISASVTGAALSALHKFLLYGFLTNTPSAAQGMTCMAAALLQCTFEESSQGAMVPGGSVGAVKYFEPGGGLSAAAIATLDTGNSSRGLGSIRRSLSNEPVRPSTVVPPHHHLQHPHGAIHSREGTNTSRTVVGTMLLHDDEQVVLKLLELSALVVRCSLHPSEPLVSTDLIVGLLDTCLHVSHRAKRASPLLKSAAADSLGQIVLQVFSTITSPSRSFLARSNTIDTIDTGDSIQNSSSPQNGEDGNDNSPLLDTRKEILLKLTNLLNPQQNNDATCATSLTLMNMAFETLREEFTAPEITILQNDFCKYLLQWSTTHDLMILNLTLRVIFNLFQSMRNHLKVPLEVFLTSVHLRILDPTSSATSEEREVALESLLEFCQEVALMQDIYLNYDCDISCTNLYESICTTLGRVACADGTSNRLMLTPTTPSLIPSAGTILPTTVESMSSGVSFDHSNLQGGLASFRNQPSVRHMNAKSGAATAATATTAADDSSTLISDLSSHGGTSAHLHSPRREGKSTLTGMVGAPQAPQIPLNILNKLALDGILAILDSIFRRCQSHLRYEDMIQHQSGAGGNSNDGASLDGVSIAASEASQIGNLRWQMAPMSEEDLQKRKIKKHFLEVIATAFNEDPFGDKWIQIAKKHEILETFLPPRNPSPTDTRVLHKLGVAPDDVGELLYSTQRLNKASVGEYISKGPKEKYPFHAQVLDGFVSRYDFSELTFAGAIRKFLSKFRLPGEAQCIDRLMEAFSKEYYEQKGKQPQPVSTKTSENGERPEEGGKKEADNEVEDNEVKMFNFKNSDAVFVLSFSTIMLNTDLHNPSMRRNRRMTLQQFIKNNRGINDGENIPDEFLTELYEQIKTKEIQVQAEVGEFFSMTQTMMSSATGNTASSMEAFRASWDSVLSNRTQNVAAAFFTPPYAARQSIERAGIHDKEMFVTIASCGAIQSLAGVFCRSWDDDLVVRALRGMKQMSKMCEFFETDEILNDILQILLRLGRDYIMGCTALEHSGYDNGAPILPNGRMPMAVLGEENDESAIIDTESPVPTSLLCSPKGVDPLHASFAVHARRNNISVVTGDSVDEEDEDEREDEDEDTVGAEEVVDVTGSAAHRGLLALDTAFLMLRSYAPRVREAWPAFIDCICALRDARGLPAGLSDLDDFADSNGNVLPLSSYAQMSQKRLDDHYRALLGKDDANKKKSWLRSFFGAEKKETKKDGSAIGGESERSAPNTAGASFVSPSLKEELSTFSLRLLDVAENCDVEKVVVQMGSSTGNEDEPAPPDQQLHHEQQFIAIQALLMSVDEYPFDDDPVMEQHAIFSLELAARALLTNREKATELFSLFLLKFESILSKVDDHKIPAPFMVERVVVTILRSSIHLYDLPDLRPHLRASLHLLMMSLPRKFISQISDRMACGLAIILRASFHFFETPNEWTFMGDTLDMLANYQAARGFVFDGIASTVEYSLPSPPDDVDSAHLTTESASTLTFEHKEDESSHENADPTEQPPPLSKDACVALTRILIRFVLGFYQNDLSLSLPAMLCLEKVYRHLVLLLVQPAEGKNELKDGVEPSTNGKVPDKELWQNVIVSVYSVCRSVDEESSRCGMECYSRLMRETGVDEISDDKWLAILYLMVNKQPPLSADVSRANTFAVLGQVLMMVLPPLSHRSENWEDLTDLIQQIAAVSEENLREGRKGSVSLLFQNTVQTVTECANKMMSEDFDGDKEFSTWASETLLAELEKFGALGGSIMNVAATK